MTNTIPQTVQEPYLITLREATRLLGMKDTRITSRLIREGKLRARKLGNRVMITTKSLRKYVGE